MTRARALNRPRAIRVDATADGTPRRVGGRAVESVRETWLVEDRWWTQQPLRRRYWEVITDRGADLVVFRDLHEGGWHVQRA